jgi:hypothetical protein
MLDPFASTARNVNATESRDPGPSAAAGSVTTNVSCAPAATLAVIARSWLVFVSGRGWPFARFGVQVIFAVSVSWAAWSQRAVTLSVLLGAIRTTLPCWRSVRTSALTREPAGTSVQDGLGGGDGLGCCSDGGGGVAGVAGGGGDGGVELNVAVTL